MARRRRHLRVLTIALALALGAGALIWQHDRGDMEPDVGTTATSDGHGSAVTTAERRLPDAHDDFAAAFRAGLRNFQAGDAHAAARAFEKAVSIRPHEVQARVNLGFAYIEMNRPNEAETLFARALEIAPMTANAYYGLAEAMEARGDLEGATGAMRTFLHFAAAEDPFRRRAMAALWEWQEIAKNRPNAVSPPETARAAVQDAPPPGLARTGIAVFDAPLQTLDGDPVSLARHEGKVIVLNVWATWCGPCRVELPALARLGGSLDPAEFAVVGVSIDKKRFLAAEYLRDLGIEFASYWDSANRLTGELLDARTIPLTLVISPAGEVLASHRGARDWSHPDVVSAIRQLANPDMPIDARVSRLREGLR